MKRSAPFPVFVGFLTVCFLLAAICFGMAFNSDRPQNKYPPMVDIECLDRSIEPYAEMWRLEISRRFPDALGVIVHGGDFVEGHWIVGTAWQNWKHVTPIEEVITHYEHIYPGRVIVLVSCNPGHVRLTSHPGVYYALDSVWVYPDRQMDKAGAAGQKLNTLDKTMWNILLGDESKQQSRSEMFPGYVGSIFEFIEAR